MTKKIKLIKLRTGQYRYGKWIIICHGYYSPDKCVMWEATNEETQDSDYHYPTLRQVVREIQEDELKKQITL